MTGAADTQRLLEQHMRRLQKLKEQQALLGIDADPRIAIEIEDIEATIDGLRAALAELGGAPAAPALEGQGASRAGAPGQSNQGIIVTGGTLNANQLAVGPGSRAIQVTHAGARDSRAEAEERVGRSAAELLRALDQQASTVEDYGELSQAIRQVVEEARKAQPSKLALRSQLSGISGAVGAEANLASELLALQSAVEALIGLLKG
jgi:hypothetical protein